MAFRAWFNSQTKYLTSKGLYRPRLSHKQYLATNSLSTALAYPTQNAPVSASQQSPLGQGVCFIYHSHGSKESAITSKAKRKTKDCCSQRKKWLQHWLTSWKNEFKIIILGPQTNYFIFHYFLWAKNTFSSWIFDVWTQIWIQQLRFPYNFKWDSFPQLYSAHFPIYDIKWNRI